MNKASIEDVKALLRTVYFWGLFPAVLLVPLWVGIGRLFFGVGGWVSVFSMLLFAPFLFLVHLVVLSINLAANRTLRPKALSRATFIALSFYYISVLVWGAAIVDSAQTSSGSASVLTQLFGGSTGLSGALAVLSGFLAVILLGVVLITSLIHLALSKRVLSSRARAGKS